MFTWRDSRVQEEHVADLAREVERVRLAEQAIAENAQKRRNRRRSLKSLKRLFPGRGAMPRANGLADRDESEWPGFERPDQSHEQVTESSG